MLQPLAELCEQLADPDQYVEVLQSLAEHKEGVAAAIALAKWRQDRGEQGLETLLAEIRQFPLVSSASSLGTALARADAPGRVQDLLQGFKAALEPLLLGAFAIYVKTVAMAPACSTGNVPVARAGVHSHPCSICAWRKWPHLAGYTAELKRFSALA